MGIRGKVSRSTIADANEQRDWRIYADLAHSLISKASRLYSNEPFAVELEQTVYALDATTIDLCLSIVSVGKIPTTQRSHKTPYPAGFTLQCSNIYSHLRRQTPRGQYPRYNSFRARRLLRDGSRLSGLRQIEQPFTSFRILSDQGQIQFKMPQDLLPSGRQNNWLDQRPVSNVHRFLSSQRLSTQASSHQILRFRNRKNIRVSDQQFLFIPTDHCSIVSLSLARRAFLQVDQTKSAHQELLRNFGECRKNTNLDCHIGIRSCCYIEKTTSSPLQSLHNSTGAERLGFRKNATNSTTYKNESQNGIHHV